MQPATDAARIAQRAQEIRRLQGASLRALSGDVHLELRGATAWRAERLLPLNAAHLYPGGDGTDIQAARGASDGMALRVRHSDSDRHLQLLPVAPAARFVFELLEQLRCESLATQPGVRANLEHRFQAWANQFQESTLAETELGQLLFALALVSRSKITGTALGPELEDSIEAARLGFPAGVGALTARLRAKRFDQEEFACHALQLARLVDTGIAAHLSTRGARPAPRRRADKSGFSLQLDVAGDAAPVGRASLDASPSSGSKTTAYRAFTGHYDQVTEATRVVRPALLRRYRGQVEQAVQAAGTNQRLLERTLRALLCRPDTDGWHGGAEQGQLDGARLAALVASPSDHRIFRAPSLTQRPYACVSFLVDCSGSMRHHAVQVAAFLDMAVRALDRCAVPSEVLGYTTRTWNGGRAAAQWRRVGSPPAPGRLNELNHVVFKQATSGWRASQMGLAALLHQPLYKEGVDGEAVRWALGRLDELQTERRVLLVLSDGSPSDTATALANGESYLQQDLAQTVRRSCDGRTSIAAIGVGLDMSPYFGQHAAILDGAELASNQALRTLTALLRGLPALR